MQRVRSPFLIVSVVCLNFLSCFPVTAQLTSTYTPVPGQRDANAIAIVQKSLAVLGGVNAIAAVQSIESSGTILKMGSSDPMTFRWETQVSGSHFEFRRETTQDGKTRVFASGHGKPGFGILGNPAKRMALHMSIASVPFDLPGVVLYAEFQDPAYAISSINSPEIGGVIHIRIANTSDLVLKAITQQDWYFDPQTALPIRVEYNLPDINNALDTMPAACLYSKFATEQGVQYPTNIEAFEQGQQISRTTVSSVQLNTPISSSDFDLPLESAKNKGAN